MQSPTCWQGLLTMSWGGGSGGLDGGDGGTGGRGGLGGAEGGAGGEGGSNGGTNGVGDQHSSHPAAFTMLSDDQDMTPLVQITPAGPVVPQNLWPSTSRASNEQTGSGSTSKLVTMIGVAGTPVMEHCSSVPYSLGYPELRTQAPACWQGPVTASCEAAWARLRSSGAQTRQLLGHADFAIAQRPCLTTSVHVFTAIP
eukprot:7387393-Prymnesium_polylepis.1